MRGRNVGHKLRPCAAVLLGLAIVISGCGALATPLPAAFSGVDGLPGWTSTEEVRAFDRETIYHLVDGQADVFFAYGFQQVAVRRYENREGVAVDVHVWRLATPSDAYGLFTADTTGVPADVGNEGDLKSGRRLAFWQDRYAVWVYARPALDDAELLRFARALSEALPRGGERPALMDRLPGEGMVERSAVFFHEEISIQDRLWLGGENLLGLSPQTDGILARYEAGGGMAQLLLVQYPSSKAASAGLAALAVGRAEGLVATDVHADLLGAVFGEVDKAAASRLLVEALVREPGHLASGQAPTLPPRPSPTSAPSPTPDPTPTPDLTPSPVPSLTSTSTPSSTPTAISAPQEQGMDVEVLYEGLMQLEELPNLRSLIILRNDALVLERYYHGAHRSKSADMYSVGKSVISALVGIAIREGYVDSADQRLSEFFPEHFPREDDPRKNDLTLYHFLTMSAGFEWTQHLPIRLRHVHATLNLPLEAPPGQTFCYNGWLPHTFSVLITQESGMSTKAFADQYLFGPLDISVSNWGMPFGVYNGAGGLWLTPQDMAKFGQLYLHQGSRNGLQIVPAEWVAESTRIHIALDPETQYGAEGYGYYWWLKTIEGHRVFSARGYYGQSIHVIPDLNVVMVVTKGEAQEDPDWFNYGFIEDHVIASIKVGE